MERKQFDNNISSKFCCLAHTINFFLINLDPPTTKNNIKVHFR